MKEILMILLYSVIFTLLIVYHVDFYFLRFIYET
jgi:hypothetical protein